MGTPSIQRRKFPARPEVYMTEEDFKAVVGYALESAAQLVSPSPKKDGEDEEFACDDVAQAIRNLGKLL